MPEKETLDPSLWGGSPLGLYWGRGGVGSSPRRTASGDERQFERASDGARSGAHDDAVMGLALAVYAAPLAPSAQVVLGSAVGGGRRVT